MNDNCWPLPLRWMPQIAVTHQWTRAFITWSFQNIPLKSSWENDCSPPPWRKVSISTEFKENAPHQHHHCHRRCHQMLLRDWPLHQLTTVGWSEEDWQEEEKKEPSTIHEIETLLSPPLHLFPPPPHLSVCTCDLSPLSFYFFCFFEFFSLCACVGCLFEACRGQSSEWHHRCRDMKKTSLALLLSCIFFVYYKHLFNSLRLNTYFQMWTLQKKSLKCLKSMKERWLSCRSSSSTLLLPPVSATKKPILKIAVVFSNIVFTQLIFK